MKILNIDNNDNIDSNIISLLSDKNKIDVSFLLKDTNNLKIIKEIKQFGLLSNIGNNIKTSSIINIETNIKPTKVINKEVLDIDKEKLEAQKMSDISKSPILTTYLQLQNSSANLSKLDNRIEAIYPTGEFSLGSRKKKYEKI